MGLTPKQAKFVDEYQVDFNATQAAIRSGYNKNSARQQGAENLTKPVIQQAIAERRAEVAERTSVTVDFVVNTTRELVERCMRAVPVRDKEGNETGEWKFDSAGAAKGLKLLGDHVGAWGDKGGGGEGVSPALEALAQLGLEELRALANRKPTVIEGETA